MKLDGATFQSEIEIAKRNSPRAVCVCVCIIAVIFRVPSRGIAIFSQTLPTGMEKGGGNGGEGGRNTRSMADKLNYLKKSLSLFVPFNRSSISLRSRPAFE